MSKGLIIIGYPGIGKSACGGKDNCVDLESSMFTTDMGRIWDWHIPYCNLAMDIANQGYTVFVSSHYEVRDRLQTMELKPNISGIAVFAPFNIRKGIWYNRLFNRYERSKLSKDKKALDRVHNCYQDDMDALIESGLPCYGPDSDDYDLMEYVKLIRHDIERMAGEKNNGI